MNRTPTPRQIMDVAESLLSAPRFAQAVSTAAVGTAVLSHSIVALSGWAGLIGIVVTLVVLAALSLVVRRARIEWLAILPVSLLLFLGWAGLTIAWSQYKWATVGGLAYLGAFSVLGLYVAMVRDTIQIVRIFGDVFRLVLAASLVIEIISGLLIDSPIAFLGVAGNLGQCGPIQGVMGNHNQLGLVGVLALITFCTELRTRSVQKGLGLGSVIIAALSILLAQSPVITGVVVLVGVSVVALYALRRVAPARRTVWQLTTLAIAIVVALATWAVRSRVVELLNASGDLTARLTLWQRVWQLIGLHTLEGWGWTGNWHTEIQPFAAFGLPSSHLPPSALNGFLDVWFQLGLIGVVIFVVLVGLALVRSWLLAGQRRSVVFTWPALMLIALIAVSLAESVILVEYGWLIFVLCCVKAAGELSWRRAFAAPLTPDLEHE